MHASPVDWETPLHLAQEACLLHPKVNRGSPRSPAPAAQTQRASARVLVASQPRSASGLRIWSANRTPSSYRAVGRPPGEPRPAGATVLQNTHKMCHVSPSRLADRRARPVSGGVFCIILSHDTSNKSSRLGLDDLTHRPGLKTRNRETIMQHQISVLALWPLLPNLALCWHPL